MIRSKNRRTVTGIGLTAAVAATALALAAVPVSAHGRPGAGTPAGDSAATVFAASLNGANEVPAGDGDGHALGFVAIQDDQVSFAFKWKGIAAPTAAHIHVGGRGVNGDVKVPFFAEKLRGGRTSVTGTVTVDDAQLLDDIRKNPGGFYLNLHTREFPGGAVRGQMHQVTRPFDFSKALSNFQAPVIRGEQIYACTQGADGTYTFTQNNVSARLAGGIRHSFVQPTAGPPQWVAPDGSSVTGAVQSRTPNGTANIPELDLLATQTGEPEGLLADTTEILRLNTVGGVATAGTCDPAETPKVGVPYQADYLFIQR